MTRPDTWHIMAALKEIVTTVNQLRKDIDELRDEVKVMDRGAGIRFVLSANADEEEYTDDESSAESAQSAP